MKILELVYFMSSGTGSEGFLLPLVDWLCNIEVLCYVTAMPLNETKATEYQCIFFPLLCSISPWRRHASLPLEAIENPGSLISPVCRRPFPCRQWKSASFGYSETFFSYSFSKNVNVSRWSSTFVFVKCGCQEGLLFTTWDERLIDFLIFIFLLQQHVLMFLL